MKRRYLVPIALWIVLGICIYSWVRDSESPMTAAANKPAPTDVPPTEVTTDKLPADWPIEKKIDYYIGKLKDRSFTTTYGHGYTWYTAAEELGQIGKPAIPPLMERLETKDDYERSVTLYALLLASQAAELKQATGSEYIDVDAWDTKQHAASVQTARDWWQKWGHLWE